MGRWGSWNYHWKSYGPWYILVRKIFRFRQACQGAAGHRKHCDDITGNDEQDNDPQIDVAEEEPIDLALGNRKLTVRGQTVMKWLNMLHGKGNSISVVATVLEEVEIFKYISWTSLVCP